MEKELEVIALLREARNLSKKIGQNAEIRQSQEYKNMLKTSQALKEKRTQLIESIAKNLNDLMGQKHAIHRILQNSEGVDGLPISHKYQQQTVNLVADAIQFINDMPEMCKPHTVIDDNFVTKLCENVKLCGEAISVNLNKAKTQIDQVETVKNNIDVLKDCYVTCNDDLDESILNLDGSNLELNGSIY
ncbi:uncharacterized protein LOC107267750 [Cephus cinctus]|uniref:Uncharacterized protein LOC107267750 n=1 Tax=Cephus cinctus TaxID=211228 RepID=A0AAJ7BVX5_CEPCN|nr:uncharacterized protein LOC107267750 [Cephus cinctus]XP_015595280.1 uncharacterized protein LOC107267750 [Cephus cinctus]XP_024940936.1 uncharacterized protein LOC107267750 [Cephus cinctus]